MKSWKMKILSTILSCILLCLSGCGTSKTSLPTTRNEIEVGAQDLDKQYLEIDVDGSTGIYFFYLMDAHGTWYLKRDENVLYSYNSVRKDWGVRKENEIFRITNEHVYGAGKEAANEVDDHLDALFHFYAMVNVQDNTPRTYQKGDQSFERFVTYYEKLSDIPKDQIQAIEVLEGKEKGSTRLVVRGTFYDEEEEEDSEWKDVVEIRFNVDKHNFQKKYDELIQKVKKSPVIQVDDEL